MFRSLAAFAFAASIACASAPASAVGAKIAPVGAWP